ncbi:hypothetical protein B0H14DRAFT_3441889 [Mycena olivaceomarginata]|nr:hypothetical protein B0H14DRAFT_3441889 [Mycena olivaceomarginata]
MQSGNSGADNPCADRWKNMIEDVTSKMWGIFDETGIFLALCRHGFVLVIADMIRSGELAKYPLAIVEELLDTFGMNLGAGYDVGCHFGATVANSELGEKASRNNLKCLEGVDSYSRFHDWLREEKDYLLSLKDAPKTDVETLEMEYVQKLVNLSASEARYTVLLADARRARGDDAAYVPGTSKVELARRHGKEKVERDLESVQELERQLEIVDRWTPASPRWESTTVAVMKRKYRLALDALELLIVERIFELTKMNRSQTGYKMRKHIAKALQARSKAVRNAIDRYNSAASLLDPPMRQLTWETKIQSRPWTRPAYRLAMDRYFKILRAREEIRHLNVEIPRVVTWIRDENRILRRKEAELNSVEGKTEEEAAADQGMAVQVQLYRERRGRFDEAHMRRFWALARTPGFTGSVMPGVSVEWRATRREAQAQAAAQADGERVGPEGASGGIGVEHEGEEEMVVDGGDEGEWVEEDEGDDAMEAAVSDLLYTISMVAIDDRGEPPQVQES